jgi:hypothetical protein
MAASMLSAMFSISAMARQAQPGDDHGQRHGGHGADDVARHGADDKQIDDRGGLRLARHGADDKQIDDRGGLRLA